jgi:anti-sigma B factor antagonist
MTREPTDHTWSNWGTALFRLDSTADCAVVSAAGEIDIHTAAGLQEALTSAFRHSPSVIIDLTQVTFLDSSALGVLIGARRRAQHSGGTVMLVRPPAIVRKLLTGTQLQQSFPVYDSLDEAVHGLSTVRTDPVEP